MSFRHALQKYLDHPNDPSVIITTPDFLVIKDAYPKALRHYLIMPRDEVLTHVHPLMALRNDKLRAAAAAMVKRVKDHIVLELAGEWLIGDDKAGQSAFKNTFIRGGVHRVPSMANMHIHVITQDFHLPRMKNRKHYNSFTTDFFVDLDHVETESSLESDDEPTNVLEIRDGALVLQRQTHRERSRSENRPKSRKQPKDLGEAREAKMLASPLVCTYCRKLFGASFATLKRHLAEEYGRKFGAQNTD